MARGIITAADVSLEEKLQQALVPESEQPYEVPENWCWVRLLSIADLKSGTSLPVESEKKCGAIRYIKVADMNLVGNEREIVCSSRFVDDYSESQMIPSSSIIFPKRGGAIFTNKKRIVREALLADLNIMAITPRINIELTYYWFLSVDLSTLNNGSNVPQINNKDIAPLCFPLPPLAEQQRIVDRIESLFAKLDEAKEKVQEVVDGFETRKAAILHKAFTGELTTQWRKEHGVGIESWEDRNLQSVCSMKITDGTHKTPTYCEASEGFPFISAKDVTSGKICWDNIKYIIPELHEELYARLAPQIDDVLLAKNGTTGVAAIVDVEKAFDLYVTLAVLRPDKKTIRPRYLLNIVNSPICKNQFDEHLTGIGVPNLHLRDIKEVIIRVPSLDEQDAIIRLVDSLLAKEQQAKEAAEAVLEQIDLTKKSILARAFRGELGTNNAAEESAINLLKELIS